MAQFNIEDKYKNNKNEYSDGDTIEDLMYEVAKGNEELDTNSFVMFYHFSKFRNNILNWYPINSNDEVLEIGSGCGAITGMLCDKAKFVHSVELSVRRASINYERHKEYDNLFIETGDINKIEFSRQFDLIILNGVLEYAALFFEGDDNPYVHLLEKCKGLLKEKGKILIAIENRMGLKYLSGTYEDHLGTINSGINGYKTGKDIKTFDKYELEQIIKNSGLKVNKFTYPFPDYKFTFEVFTDTTINNIFPSSVNLPINDKQLRIFDEDNVYRSFMHNGIMNNFSNSFLVEIGKDDISRISDYDYIKISNNRKDEYSIATILDYKNNVAIKKPLNDLSKNHLKNLCNNSNSDDVFKSIEYRYINDNAVCNLLSEDSMEKLISDNEDKALDYIDIIKDKLLTGKVDTDCFSKEFENCFGKTKTDRPLHWLKNINIDFLTNNLFKKDDEYILIDNEWYFDFYIPGEYVLWRTLFNSPKSVFNKDPYDYKMLKYIGIDRKTAQIFFEWEQHFVYEYVKGEKIPYRSIVDFDLNNLNELISFKENEQLRLNEVSEKLKSLSLTQNNLKNFLSSLSNTGIYSGAYKLTRFKQQFLKGNLDDKKNWLLSKDDTREYDPLKSVIDIMEDTDKQITSIYNDLTRKDIQIKIDKSVELSKQYKKYDVIVLSIIDYDFRIQRPQHFSKRLADKGHRIFYVNANFKNYYEENYVEDNILTVTLNSNNNSIYEDDLKNNQKIFNAIDNLIVNHCICDCVVMVDYPNWINVATHIKDRYGFKVVTDYMDDFSGFINPVKELVKDNCNKLLKMSDFVVASSNYLSEYAKQYNQNTHVIRNGTEYDYFHEAAVNPNNNRKIIGYYGAISSWFDMKIACECARRFKDTDIVLIGDITSEDKSYLEYDNIKVLGEKPYNELIDYLKNFDVCIIPFDTSTNLIKATNPVKFYEYLSAGKKVVATRIPELEIYENKYCYLENDPSLFCDKVELCLNNQDELLSKEEMYDFARNNDWDNRVNTLDKKIRDTHEKISIVVLCYNNLELTKKCVESILNYTAYPHYEIVLVDNNSDDGTKDYLIELKNNYKHIKIVLNDVNKGFAAGNNDGIRVSDGDYVALLNNDTEVTRGWLSNMLKHFKNDPELGLLGPVTNNIGNEARINVMYDDMIQMRNFAYNYMVEHFNEEYDDVNVLAMFCLMISRKVIDSVGLLDERYGRGMFEDDDYSYAAKEKGFRLTIAEDVFIHHYGSKSFNQLQSEEKAKLFEENKKKFEDKWNTKWIAHKYRDGIIE